MLWDVAKPIQARVSKPDASDNGTSHCLYVELYVWRLVNETQQLPGFSPAELSSYPVLPAATTWTAA